MISIRSSAAPGAFFLTWSSVHRPGQLGLIRLEGAVEHASLGERSLTGKFACRQPGFGPQ